MSYISINYFQIDNLNIICFLKFKIIIEIKYLTNFKIFIYHFILIYFYFLINLFIEYLDYYKANLILLYNFQYYLYYML